MSKNKVRANNKIRAREVRLIGSDGKQIGVVSKADALKKAKEEGLDLVQVTDKANPPVCKIKDYGKYLYNLKKKEKKQKTSELKIVKLSYNMSEHDMGVRMKRAIKFLENGDKVKIVMMLRGRENRLKDFAKKKTRKFLDSLNEKVSIKQENKLKKGHGGLSTIVIKS